MFERFKLVTTETKVQLTCVFNWCLLKVLPLTKDLLNGGREEEGGGDQGSGQHQEGHGAASDQGPRPAPLLLLSPPVTQVTQVT